MYKQDTQIEVKEKLIILYTYAQFNLPVPPQMVTDMLLRLNVMDYFLIQQYTSELIDKGLLELLQSEDEDLVLIKSQGRDTLSFFQDRLSNHYTTKIGHAVKELKEELKRLRVIKADYTQVNDTDYSVKLQILDGDTELIGLKLSVPTNKIAKKICEQWREDATQFYHQIITAFNYD